jgi:type 1 glutamine amidotransferase
MKAWSGKTGVPLAVVLILLTVASPVFAVGGSKSTNYLSGRESHFPDGYDVVVHLNAREKMDRKGKDSEQLAVSAARHALSKRHSALWSRAWYDPERIDLTATGLLHNQEYLLALAWWDAAGEGLTQSLQYRDEEKGEDLSVLPPAPAAAFSKDCPVPALVMLPLPEEKIKEGRLQLSIQKERGSGAVLQALWLLRKSSHQQQKKILIITGEDYGGHDWTKTAPALAKVLRQDSRFEVAITETPAMTGSPWLHCYDLVVVHFKNYDDRFLLEASTGEAFRNYVASGKGLIFTHFACGAFENWLPFEKITGRIWNPELRAHDPYGPFEVRMTSESHPITSGLKNFTLQDELYTCLEGSHPITVLCDALSVVDERVYPMAFVVENTGGYVFHCLLGHNAQVYEYPEVGLLYRNAALWALGLSPEE